MGLRREYLMAAARGVSRDLLSHVLLCSSGILGFSGRLDLEILSPKPKLLWGIMVCCLQWLSPFFWAGVLPERTGFRAFSPQTQGLLSKRFLAKRLHGRKSAKAIAPFSR